MKIRRALLSRISTWRADFTWAANVGSLTKLAPSEVLAFSSRFSGQDVTDYDANHSMSRGVALAAPAEPDSTHKAAAQQIAQLSGARFDQQYMQGQVADHKETVALFQKEASSRQDPQLKGFARKYLPILQHRLEMAESIQAAKSG